MGTEISQEDCDNIVHLCDQVIEISEYRAQLYDYLKNRMMAIAPNLTLMVGELVGARLIAHAGECMHEKLCDQGRTLVVSWLPGNLLQHSKGEGLNEREVGML